MIKSTEVSDLNHSATVVARSLKCLAQGQYMAEAGIGPNHDLSVVSPVLVANQAPHVLLGEPLFLLCFLGE